MLNIKFLEQQLYLIMGQNKVFYIYIVFILSNRSAVFINYIHCNTSYSGAININLTTSKTFI